jgi:hypothetical protein
MWLDSGFHFMIAAGIFLVVFVVLPVGIAPFMLSSAQSQAEEKDQK